MIWCDKNSCWCDLPTNIISRVGDHLSCIDLHNCLFVCKKWQSFNDELKYRVSFLPVIQVCCTPILNRAPLVIPNGTQLLCRAKFFDFPSQKNCCISTPIPQGSINAVDYSPKFCGSILGWLLFVGEKPIDGTFRLFFFNPIYSQTVALPPLDYNMHGVCRVICRGASFSTIPTCSDFVISLLWEIAHEKNIDDIYYPSMYAVTIYNQKDGRWRSSEGIHELTDVIGFTDLAYADGMFYCAVTRRNNAVLPPRGRNYPKFKINSKFHCFNTLFQKWNVLDNCLSTISPCYLVKSDDPGELLLARFKDDCCHIYRFDLFRKDCTTVYSLGNRILFLDAFSSCVIPAVGAARRFANTVFFYRRNKNRVETTSFDYDHMETIMLYRFTKFGWYLEKNSDQN